MPSRLIYWSYPTPAWFCRWQTCTVRREGRQAAGSKGSRKEDADKHTHTHYLCYYKGLSWILTVLHDMVHTRHTTGQTPYYSETSKTKWLHSSSRLYDQRPSMMSKILIWLRSFLPLFVLYVLGLAWLRVFGDATKPPQVVRVVLRG